MDEWLTYAEAAERLDTTVEAVRLRALRGRWQKTIGNDRRPRVRLPEGWPNDGRTPVERRERKPRNDGRTAFERSVDPTLVYALESHIKTLQGDNETLKEQLAAAEARASEEADALREHNATLKADVERLEAQLRLEADRLAGAEARAEKQATELGARDAERLAMLTAEQAKTAQAIAAFAALADKLDALATTRRPSWPWWRRLVG